MMTLIRVDRCFSRALVIVFVVVLGSVVAFEDINEVVVDTNRTAKYRRIGNRVTKTGLNLNSCDTQSGYSGTCMTRFNCMRNGGTVSGFCGTYGVCCETNLPCGQTSNLKRTLIQTPTSIPTRCTYTFEPYSMNVCQIKVEMEQFQLQQPVTRTSGVNAGDSIECLDNLFINDMTICGNNDGQHIYVPFDVTGGTDSHVNLIFNLPTRDPITRWRLIVTQLECPKATARKGLLPFAKTAGLQDLKNMFSSQNNDLPYLAPPGCTQYYTDQTGIVTSFNYNDGKGPYMTNLNYAICFKRDVSNSGMQFIFTDIGLPSSDKLNGYDTDCHALVPTVGKTDDYLMIPGAMVSSEYGNLHPTYFCSATLKGTKVDYMAAGPFAIYFNSDDLYTPQDIGFQIAYTIF